MNKTTRKRLERILDENNESLLYKTMFTIVALVVLTTLGLSIAYILASTMEPR